MCPIRNVDVLATTVSGTINVDVNANANDAATNADLSWGLGEVGLVNAAGDKAVLGRLPGQGSFSVLVAPGTYDLYYGGSTSSTILTNTYVKFQGGIVVGASPLSLDIAIPATPVSTTITLNGAALPTSGAQSHGFFELRKATGEHSWLAPVSAGTSSMLVVAGTYDLYYSGSYVSANEMVPTNTSAKLQTGIVVGTSPLSLEIDVPFTTVTVSVGADGAAGLPVGLSLFTLKNDAGDNVPLTLTSTPGAFSSAVIPGTYDLYYGPAHGGQDGLPENHLDKLRSGIVVGTAPLTLEMELPTVTSVSGKVTVNGAAVSGISGTSYLTLNSAADSVDLSLDTASAYSTRVIPGTYDLTYTNAYNIAGAPVNYRTNIKSGIVVGTSPLILDIDIPATTVSGRVTVNGAGHTGSASADGEPSLALIGATGSQARLSSLDDSSFSVLVIPGTYDLYYLHYLIGNPGTRVPINTKALLKKGIVVGTSSLALDIDVPAVTVSGAFTINGAAVPFSSDVGVGRLTLDGLDGDSGTLAFTASDSTNPSDVARGAFSELVIPGSYELSYRVYRAGPKIPGNSRVDLGAFNVP
jgi:hypothetical protein